LTRGLAGFLSGIGATDPLTSLAASTLLMLVARVACHWTQSAITKSQNVQGSCHVIFAGAALNHKRRPIAT
jgi:hypothetical protein